MREDEDADRDPVKLFRSLEWEGQLNGFVATFDKHKDEIHFRLSMHASLGIEQANMTLVAVQANVQQTDKTVSMALLLQLLRSPKDRQLMKKIDHYGGPDRILKDEALMKELIAESGEKDIQSESKVLTSKDKDGDIIKEIVREANRTIEEMVKENDELFTRKFKAQERVLADEMRAVSKREGDRIIGAILSGPHDRILDPVCFVSLCV